MTITSIAITISVPRLVSNSPLSIDSAVSSCHQPGVSGLRTLHIKVSPM